MKSNRIFLLSVLFVLLFFACSKHNNGPSSPTGPSQIDSFFSWQVMDSLVPKGAEDIWFVSLSKGFYAGGDNTLYQSQDSGKTWSMVKNSTVSSFYIGLFFVDGQYGFAHTSSQVERTNDGGNTWTLKQLPTATALNIFFTTPSTGFCGDQNSGLYKTTDTGNTWKPVYEPSGSGFGFYPFFLDPTHGFVITGNGYCAASTDSGSTWNAVSASTVANPSTSYSTLQFIDGQTGFFAGTNGLLKTTNGGQNWNAVYPHAGSINIVKFFDVNTGYYLSDAAIYKTVDGGQTWTTSAKVVNGSFTGMHFIDPAHGWACTSNGFILRLGQ
jgi:photosystem II stability/assembly factor-like uncharacterized protein